MSFFDFQSRVTVLPARVVEAKQVHIIRR